MCIYIWKVKVLVTQLCLTLCNPKDCSPPGSSVRGILQARILEWVAISFFLNWTWVSYITGRFFTIWAVSGVYICDGLSFSHKKGNSAIFDNMDEPCGHYAKWNKSEIDKYCKISLMCGNLKEKQQKTSQKQRIIAGCQRLRVAKWLKVIKKYKLLVIK